MGLVVVVVVNEHDKGPFIYSNSMQCTHLFSVLILFGKASEIIFGHNIHCIEMLLIKKMHAQKRVLET